LNALGIVAKISNPLALSYQGQPGFFLNLCMCLPFADPWLRALGHEFVQMARAIIHAAV
jgi:hypothetical protein